MRGIGSDVVEIDRVAESLDRLGDRFVSRVLSPPERQVFAGLRGRRRAEYVAGRFAAKEAVAKALGCGIGRLGMTSVDIRIAGAESADGQGNGADAANGAGAGPGAPPACVHGLVAHFLRSPKGVRIEGRVLVSITHTRQLAFAVAVWESV
ncbi:holo-ACP synthase [Alicyclobacillus sp.]|uniref:holo-ACP synthase n=1 Tax=Alicyclobacillus sp. TaxID=61169 RepID=UPI0025B807FC|nr:holo-ACP synthase [Alicyclobacillus sp.]